jgi:hypothetical protein
MFKRSFFNKYVLALVTGPLLLMGLTLIPVNALSLTGNGAFGIAGTITSPAPTSAATISTPTSGQSFTSVPITISGICVSGLLIKIFINDIFSGSVDCVNNSYSVSSDLFVGTNNIVAEDFDSLNQAGPNSNTVSVAYVNNAVTAQSTVTITTNYAKIGANPGSLLSWPISITGGTGPYAISVNWGDGKQPTLISQASPGSLNLTHTYSISGVYNVTINATDSVGSVAFLQVVGVANGPSAQNSGAATKPTATKTVGINSLSLAIIISILVIVPPTTFWLGNRHQRKVVQSRFNSEQKLF